MVISTANVDPHVFGGQHNSKLYAQSFDPSRDHSDSLSWNGRLADVKVRTRKSSNVNFDAYLLFHGG